MTAVDRAIETSRASVAERWDHASEIEVEQTGGYALAFEGESAMRRDLQVNIGVSVVLVLIVLWFAWRRPIIVLLGALPVAFGVVLGFGLFSIFVREVVVLALVSGAVLAALGIDFVIHLLEPLRSKGRHVTEDDVTDAARRVGHSLVLAAVTTIVAFLSFVLVSDGFLRAMGALTACGIAACLVSAFFVLPALLSVCRSRVGRLPDQEVAAAAPRVRWASVSPARIGVRVGEWSSSNPWRVIAATVLISGVCVAYLATHPPVVETDLRKIHAKDSEAVRVQARFAEVFGFIDDPVLLLVSDARGEGALLDGLARLEPELEKLSQGGSVAGWTSATGFVPPPMEQNEVLAVLRRKDPAQIVTLLRQALEEEGFDASVFDPAIGVIESAIRRTKILTAAEVSGLGFGGEVRTLLSTTQGSALAMIPVHPSETLWEAEHRERLFSDLRTACRNVSVDADLAGLHAASSEAASFVVEHFVEGTGVALGAVVILVILLLRRGRRIAAALAPVILGCLWTLTVWNWLGWKVHFMNVGILPMILGIGVDDGIHLVARYAREPAKGVKAVVRSTAPAVVLTTFTTLAAFGTLAFSSTQGLASVGVLCTLGVSFCLVASLVVLPALLALERD
jgi:predicted RND superfamily exporter protein